MRIKKRFTFLRVIVLKKGLFWGCGLLAVFTASCQKSTQKTTVQPTAVTVFKVTPQTLPATYDFLGVAASSHPVEIRARIEGYLLQVSYVEGQPVEEGQVLFRLDPTPFQAALAQAEGELAKQQALLVNAEQNLARLKPLYEENAVSKRDLDFGVSQQLSAAASVATAKAQVQVAELNLSYATITSPISGLTGFAQFREGTFISPSINGLLTTVSVINPIWVNFSVSENELLREQAEVKAGRLEIPDSRNFEVLLRLPDGSFYGEKGKVNFSSPTLDPMTGTMMIRAVFANAQGTIRPGQFVRVQIIGAKRPNAIFVPQASIQQSTGGMFVYVISENNTAELRPVVVGEWYENYWIITQGLKKDELVVVDGVNKIGPKSRVTVTHIDEPKAP